MHNGHILLDSFLISHSSDGRGRLISTGGLTIAAFRQESTDGGVVAESNSAVVRLGGGLRTAELSEEVRANGPIRLVGNHHLRIDLIKDS